MKKEKLAIEGGPPVRSKPFAPWPFFSEDEINAVTSTLKSGNVNYWTGNEGRDFEREFAEYTNCKYAVALANGSIALELALYSLGIGPGDEVITTSRTFIASASSIVIRGATPVLTDVDPISQNITVDSILPHISLRTKAIIVVHLAGWSCEMDSINEMAIKYGLKVIEDCAQSHGGTYRKKPVGSLGDVAAFSFCQDKIMTTGGEGGMLTTNNYDIWERAWSYKDHGKSYDAVYNKKHSQGFRWLHESFGTNFRLSEMQSTIGRIQLKKLNMWNYKRNYLASILNELFSKIINLRVTMPPPEINHAYYKYYVFLRPETIKDGWGRDRIMSSIVAEGIPCFAGICGEIYLEKAFIASGMTPKDRFKVAKELSENSLMFLVHPTLCENDMVDIYNAVIKVFSAASK